MAGFVVDPYGGAANLGPSVNDSSAPGISGSTDTAFLLWVLAVGIVLPVMIIGGLQFAGFHFVFKR